MQRQMAGDQELTLKKRARRRLVGAIALVLLMLGILPLVLKDRSQTSAADEIKITLPSDNLAVTNDPTPAPQPSSDFDSNVVPSESPTPTATELAGTDSEATPTEASTSLPVEEDTPAKPEVAARKFYVQVGVFSDIANVKRLQTKLEELGYKSQTEKISTPKGEKIRLKTQVFTERNEAAIALENIKGAGLTGMVVSQ